MSDSEFQASISLQEELARFTGASISRLPAPLLEMSPAGIRQRWQQSEWAPWSGPAGRSSAVAPWSQDPLPYLLAPDDWLILEDGLKQRALFLERCAEDLYGERQLLQQEIIPEAEVDANPSFLWAMAGCRPEGGWLSVAAFDVVRTSDGWTVVEDHLQEPRGLERLPLLRRRSAQAFPEALHACRPASILAGLAGLRGRLEGASGTGAERVVILVPDLDETPSPEFSSLARSLDADLADGEDLAVREGRLWLRTVDGLLPVCGLLRFLPDVWSDPLELRPDTGPGVPALCQAIRAGRLIAANPLGTGLLESSSLWPFHDRICQFLLDEPLRLPEPKSLPCASGSPWIFADCRNRIFKRAHPDTGSALSGAHLGESILTDRIRCAPGDWIAQERIDGETVPLIGTEDLLSGPSLLRLFAMRGPEGWSVLPGGFARTVRHHRLGDISVICKDLWVTAPAATGSSPRATGRRRTSDEVPSRVAEDLWWMGRYAERAEMRARVLRSLFLRLGNANVGSRNGSELEFLTRLAGTEEIPCFRPVGHVAGAILEAAALDLRATARNAWAVRERLSDDNVRVIERLEHNALRCRQSDEPPEIVRRLTELLLDLAALAGLGGENTVRGHGWRFLGLGRRTERGLNLMRHLSLLLSTPPEQEMAALTALLEVWDSTLTYRARTLSLPALEPATELLLLDSTNPRSVAFQIDEIIAHLKALPRAAAELTAARRIRAALRAIEPSRLRKASAPADVTAILRHLEHLASMLEIRQFAHVEPAWQGEHP